MLCFFVILFKIIEHLVFWRRVLTVTEFYSERRGNIEKTGICQYNVAILPNSFYTIGIKNLQIDHVVFEISLRTERHLASFVSSSQ